MSPGYWIVLKRGITKMTTSSSNEDRVWDLIAEKSNWTKDREFLPEPAGEGESQAKNSRPNGTITSFDLDALAGINHSTLHRRVPQEAAPSDWTARFAELTARRNAFIDPLRLEWNKPKVCQGEECQGYVYEWYGPLNLDAPGVGFVERPCKCERGKQWARSEFEKANNVEVKHYRYSLLKGSGLPLTGRFEDCTLDSFALTDNGSARWFKEFREWIKTEWIEKDGVTSQGACLLGNMGVGKTGLAIAMAREVINKLGVKVMFISAADFAIEISRAWAARDGSDYTLLDKMKNKQLLILNDLGAGHGRAKDWDDKSPMQHLFNVLDSRYNAGLPVVITSNCATPKELKEIVGDRNFNRIFDSCRGFVCTGQNLRKGVA
jgi:DNA replication protein DnaC